MSNSKNAIQEIKSLMVKFGFLADESTLLSFKLEDNTILQAAKLEVGNKIVKINDTFEQVALEDGSYRLVENFEIQVKDGSIEAVKEIFLDAKLADGTVIKVEGDSLVEGAKVIVVTPDAEIPAPDGVHELEDGTKVETKEGIIAKIEEVVSEGEGEKPEIEVEIEQPEMEMSKEMMEMLKEFVKKMGEKMSQMEQSYSALQDEFNSFKKEPAAKPIANGKTDFNKQEKVDDVDAKLAMIMSLRNNNK
jgi:preprotein translocase subunit YajC